MCKKVLTLDIRTKLNYYYIMNYYESAEDLTITKARALKELEDHCCEDIEQFFDDLGDHEEYDAQKVLAWLGY